MDVTTTVRFGPHEVTGVVLLHRAWLPSAAPAATWIHASIPVSAEEAAAVLYSAFAACGMQANDPDVARRRVAEMVLNGGCTAIEDAHVQVVEARRRGTLDDARWSVCTGLAGLAVGTSVS